MFVLMFAPNGSRLLLNTDLVFAFTEDPAGLAIAVSLNGSPMPLGVKFDVVTNDFLGGEQDGEAPGDASKQP